MNPYFAGRMADDRLARERRLADRCSPRRPVAPGPVRRARRVAGWMLVDTGLRLAAERPAG